MFQVDLRFRLVRRVLVVLALAPGAIASAQYLEPTAPHIPWILADDFESGGLCAWSLAVGGDPGLPVCFLCGDGILDLEEGEQCDDFNAFSGDGCSDLCQFEICGNGVADASNREQCDDANLNDLDDCRNNCQLPLCGDGVASLMEICDTSGNTASCDYDCTLPNCGDGIVNGSFTPPGAPGVEACDDGNILAGDGCSAQCQIEYCGNGLAEPLNFEQCDDANLNDLDDCRNNCQLPLCGDGVASLMEICDTSGNTASCDYDCTLPHCGDGIVNGSFTPPGAPGVEACDDGNILAGDGCSAQCQIEYCGNGLAEPLNFEQCDDANLNDLDDCRNNCQLPLCGDGVASLMEICDTSGNTASCDYDCTLPQCGDGIVNLAAGEQCDDNNLTNGDGCNLCHFD